MVALGGAVAEVIVHEYGRDALLGRLADPFWLQCYGNVLGWDWDSSGMGPVVLGALKESLRNRDLGLGVAGGKGRVSRRTPQEIGALGTGFGLPDRSIEALVRASKLSAKVDNAAVQDQHPLYHHAFVLSENGSWTVIQQGMNPERGMARRYQWYWKGVTRFDEEPHAAILGSRLTAVLDLTARESRASREASVELAQEDPKRLVRFLRSLREPEQSSLHQWTGEEDPYQYFRVPKRVNWEALRRTYEFRPSNYEELLGTPGVGPATVRALAYIAAAIYGEEPAWRDPVRFSFALGGKDGVPFPVDRKAMDETTAMLAGGIAEAKAGKKEKLQALRRLRTLLPEPAP